VVTDFAEGIPIGPSADRFRWGNEDIVVTETGERMVSGPSLASRAADHPLTILIPIYNDWEALELLLGSLDAVLGDRGLEAGVLVIDDGSTVPPKEAWREKTFRALHHVERLCLRRNLGHQRALGIGIAFVEDRGRCEALIVMDGDGEDSPDDVPRLVAASEEQGGTRIVFAERTRRSESTLFRVIYTTLHMILTGRGVRVGNFSIIPRARLASLAVVSEMWNHYAAAVFRSRQPISTIPTRRAARLFGRSRMNFVGLVTHGLSAISVDSEVVGVRLLIATLFLTILDLLGIAAVFYIRFATDLAIPGWATYGVGILTLLLMQLVILMGAFVFMILGGRNSASFLPKRDYIYFISDVRPLFGDEAP
jgi:glycosyltransferase involved in cell wall biosynthesis